MTFGAKEPELTMTFVAIGVMERGLIVVELRKRWFIFHDPSTFEDDGLASMDGQAKTKRSTSAMGTPGSTSRPHGLSNRAAMMRRTEGSRSESL